MSCRLADQGSGPRANDQRAQHDAIVRAGFGLEPISQGRGVYIGCGGHAQPFHHRHQAAHEISPKNQPEPSIPGR